MKKKNPRRLSLSRETVRRLDDPMVQAAVGGETGAQCPHTLTRPTDQHCGGTHTVEHGPKLQ